MSDYAHPESLASTAWLAEHLAAPHLRVVEVVWGDSPAFGRPAYENGHVPNAVAWDFMADLQDAPRGDVMDRAAAEALLSRAGITPETTVVLYSGMQNLLATFAFWLLKIYGHRDVRLLDGDRQKWLAEARPLSTAQPVLAPAAYQVGEPDWRLRAGRGDVLDCLGEPGHLLVDARSPEMFAGTDTAGAPRGGHIPGAINLAARRETGADGAFRAWRVPTVKADGTFKPAGELASLFTGLGITPERSIITYCVRGGLSTHAWFVLTQLQGYPDVREYDRSWGEWGHRGELPVEV